MIGAILGIGASIIGGLGANSAADKQAAAQRQQMEAQYGYDKDVWKFNNDEAKLDYKFLKKGTNIQRQNQESQLGYQEQTQLQDYQYGLKIQDYEYRSQMRQYNQSEKIYGQQLGFNNMAAAVARETEQRKLQEAIISTAFENQDLFVEMMQAEGEQQARGVSGRSAAKNIQSVLAQAGRSQEILAESLTSAKKSTGVQMRKIAADKYGADLRAEAARMLLPERLPELPKPLAMPRAVFQDPRKPRKSPKPIKGIAAPSTSSGWAGIASGALSAAASNVSIDSGKLKIT